MNAAALSNYLTKAVERVLYETSYYAHQSKIEKLQRILQGLTPGEVIAILDVLQELLDALAELEEENEALKNRLFGGERFG